MCWLCTFLLQDIIRSQLDAISFYMTMKKIVLEMFALDSLHRLITIRADGFFYKSYFLSVRFAVFFMSKFPSTYIEIQKPLFNFIQVFCISSVIISIHLLMLSIHHAYFIFCRHPSKYELFIKKPSNEALMCKPYSDSANNGTQIPIASIF